jgi:hypothetical protein
MTTMAQAWAAGQRKSELQIPIQICIPEQA